MANYARVNKDNLVIFVTHIDKEKFIDEEDILIHLYKSIPDSIEDRWIETSIEGTIRVRYARLGYTYNEELDAFIPPKPQIESWIFNEKTADWESPIGPAPELTEEQIDAGLFYNWNEDDQEWVLVTPSAIEEE